MAPWKDVIQSGDIQKVASYILSLQGSNPAEAKAAEGELWVEEVIKANDSKTTVKDSITEK